MGRSFPTPATNVHLFGGTGSLSLLTMMLVEMAEMGQEVMVMVPVVMVVPVMPVMAIVIAALSSATNDLCQFLVTQLNSIIDDQLSVFLTQVHLTTPLRIVTENFFMFRSRIQVRYILSGENHFRREPLARLLEAISTCLPGPYL